VLMEQQASKVGGWVVDRRIVSFLYIRGTDPRMPIITYL
jgi:hypothetical protein